MSSKTKVLNIIVITTTTNGDGDDDVGAAFDDNEIKEVHTERRDPA